MYGVSVRLYSALRPLAHPLIPLTSAEQDVHSVMKGHAEDAKQPALERI
jgi:hypothetical protein